MPTDEPDFIVRLRKLQLGRLGKKHIRTLLDYGWIVSPVLYDVPDDLVATWASWAERLREDRNRRDEAARARAVTAEVLDDPELFEAVLDGDLDLDAALCIPPELLALAEVEA